MQYFCWPLYGLVMLVLLSVYFLQLEMRATEVMTGYYKKIINFVSKIVGVKMKKKEKEKVEQ